MDTFGRWLPLVCMFCLTGVLFSAPATDDNPPPSDPVVPVPRDRDYPWMSLAQWRAEHEANCAVAARGDARLVFIGDSITALTRDSAVWRGVFGRYAYANFGIGGDRTQNVLWRLEHGETGVLKPRLVVILIGTNNLGTTRDDVGDTVRGIKAVVGKITAAFPGTKVLLLGIFPREENPLAPIRATVRRINAELSAVNDGKTVFFRDVGSVFLEPDGTLSPAVSADQLHLTEEGIRRWARAIEGDVARIMD